MQAIKSIRKLDRFNAAQKVTFEWPTKGEIFFMRRDKSYQLKKLKWQLLRDNPTFMASVGITLANGSQSPMFTG